jgi:hypothetical protein
MLGSGLLLALVFSVLQTTLSPPTNDLRANAIVLTDFNNWCSADAAYTTEMATPDQSKGSCWNTNVSANVWFRFQATTKDITVQMKTGGTEGSLRHGYLALWDSLGNEITCAQYVSSTSDLTVSHNALTIGDWYYLSVDNHNGAGGAYQGTFSLCINAGLDYDWKEAAAELTDLNNWCSADAAYSTLWATADEAKGSCQNTGPSYNRWFKFQATSKDITVQMKTGGSEGSLRHGYLALWDDLGHEITCAQYVSATSDITISHNALTVGNWYYISVDNHNGSSGGYRGTFTLCVNAGLDYDWLETAEELTDLNNWCSADAAYSTLWATADEAKGSCQNTGPSYNRWFKFQATSKDITVQMKTGGSEGSLRHGYLALWDDLGHEITCAQYVSATSDITISHNALTVGNWYYISVDNHNGSSGGYRGTFTLCVNSGLDYDWLETAEELTDLNNWCSADGAYSTLWATADEAKGSCQNTGPSYNRWFKFQATSKDITVQMKTGGSEGSLRHGYLALWDDLGHEITCAQYVSATSDITISHNALTVGNWYYISVDNHNGSSGGYRGTFTLCVNAALDYDWLEAAAEVTNLNNWCSGDAAYSTLWATPDETKGSCQKTGPSYNRWFKFQATTKDITAQLKTGGSEGSLRYGYLSLWDNKGSEITCAQYVSATSDITISHNALTVGNWYYISVDNHDGSSGGYRGTFTLCLDAGLDYDWKEGAIELTDLDNWTSTPAAYSTLWATPDEKKGSSWNSGPNFNRWFTFQAPREDILVELLTGGTEGSLRYGYIALWDEMGNEIAAQKYSSSTSDLTITSASLTPGNRYYVSVDNYYDPSGSYRGSFSLRVDASVLLPVVLLNFDGQGEEETVRLNWATSREENNESFEVERSQDAQHFRSLGTVSGAGTSDAEANYSFADLNPLPGVNYYRLRQVDFDGSFTFSPVIEVYFDQGEEIANFLVYPSPFEDQLNIFVDSGSEGPASLTLWDVSGKQVAHKLVGLQPGEQTLVWNISGHLAPGVYVLNLDQEGSPMQQAKVIRR